MAANEAIIRAAGQRYAPTKIDYSGYIEAYGHIVSGLLAKEKEIKKKNETFEGLTVKAEHPDLKDNLQFFRDTAVDDPEMKEVYTKLITETSTNNQYLTNKDFTDAYTTAYNNKSLATSTEEDHYYNTILSEDFNGKRKYIIGEGIETKSGTQYATLNDILYYAEDINQITETIKNQGIRDMIMGMDGKYIPVSKFEPNIIQALDTDSDFYKEIDKTTDKLIPLRSSSASDINPDDSWEKRKTKSLHKLKSMIKDKNVLLSAMTDLTYPVNEGDLFPGDETKEDNFMDWLLHEDEDFRTSWDLYLEGEGKDKTKTELRAIKGKIIRSFYDEDPEGTKEDFEEFLEAVYNSYQLNNE
jgi:hypothetical protein